MPTYTVRYATSDGRVSLEDIEASSERGAIAVMETAGHTPIEVRSAPTRAAPRPRRWRRPRGGRRAVVAFTQQITAVVENGIPIVAGLRAIAEQTEHAALRAALERIAARVEDGATLAEALEAAPEFFTSVYVRSVAAGEASGHLAEVLETLAQYEEQDLENRSQVRSALLYPTLVVGALVVATVIMLWFVIPQFASLFAKFGADLPWLTRVLLRTSEFMRRHGILLLLAAAALPYVWRRIFALDAPRAWLDRRILKLPIFGPLFLSSYMLRLVELLNLMNRSSLPIVQGLRITADSMANRELQNDVRILTREVEGGQTLGEGFARTRWLTPLVKRMLTVGEQSGRSDRIFEYLARYYATQTQRSIKTLSTLIEPVLICGLATIVLFFSLAIFLPMWRMLKLIGSS